MELEIVETSIMWGERYEKGDIRKNVPDDLGARLCAAGVAKDVAGNVPTQPLKHLGEIVADDVFTS